MANLESETVLATPTSSRNADYCPDFALSYMQQNLTVVKRVNFFSVLEGTRNIRL